ncbi:hypothetical protein OG568_61120 (plasmid) [Streptomyces sp. NBC_01450]|uniref:hypothetical protein n=1 Tax=Streptomyces sp. NBC_01450 TaxID=2903871 RepID=UPI002E30DD91|nr:hypothetical protein [Streptomyces sp. NBC_01450]
MSQKSFSQNILEASIEGLPYVFQGAGTIAKNLKVYGTGLAIAGTVGLKQVADEAHRYLQIYWDPDHIHPKPNYYKAGSGLVNIAGAAVYGASGVGLLGPVAGSAGAIAQGLSYYATKLLPQDAGTHYPSLPLYHRQDRARGNAHPQTSLPPNEPAEPHDQQGAPKTPIPLPERAAIAGAAAMRIANYNNQGRRDETAKAIEASYLNHPYAVTESHRSRR